MARMTEQRVTEMRGDKCICSIGTTLKAKTNDVVLAPLGVDTLNAKRLILAFVRQGPSIMNNLCGRISLRLSNLLV